METKKVRIKNLIKIFLAAAFSLLIPAEISAENYEFVSQEINEILYALSIARNFPISGDDTVFGKADFRWAGDDFDLAFDSFLLKNRLYVKKSEKCWTVSKIKMEKSLFFEQDENLLLDELQNEPDFYEFYEKKDEISASENSKNFSEKFSESASEQNLYSLDAFDVSPARLFEKAALETGLCVTYDSLPQIKVSLHTRFCSAEEILLRIAGLCTGFELEKRSPSVFHVARSGLKENERNIGKCEILLNEDFSVFCNLNGCYFSSALEKLFSLSGNDFCIDGGKDAKIGRASFTSIDVDEALETLCVLAGFSANEKDGRYYILPSKDKNRIKLEGKNWEKCVLKYSKTAEIAGLCAKRFPEIEIININENSFLYLADDDENIAFKEFVAVADSKKFSRLVQLKFIRTEQFLKNLPPFIEKSQITDSGRGDSFYFSGTEENFAELCARLHEIDRPVPRVRYDLLIMQYQSTDGFSWSPNFKAGRVSLGDMNSASANLGSVLNFNLDVVGAFGMKFAFELQSAITQSKAKVFADTTLNGVSGSTISFANTNTYRYRDNNLDPETGEPIYSGITKEIISGLKLEVTGTVTGDGMITSKITASVSRQGTDLSTTTGNPPPTSEKMITTEVRAKSGEPVVLSGLVQNEDSENISRVPFLSRIPIFGRLFKGKEKSKEQTELVIYLLPSAETFSDDGKNSFEVSGNEADELKNAFYSEFNS